MNQKIRELEKEMAGEAKKNIPEFWPGDDISVYIRVQEGEKTRTQVFTGTCLARKGTGVRETFTVRKISYSEGVERIFPLYSPFVEKIEVVKTRKQKGIAGRGKMYYMRRKK